MAVFGTSTRGAIAPVVPPRTRRPGIESSTEMSREIAPLVVCCGHRGGASCLFGSVACPRRRLWIVVYGLWWRRERRPVEASPDGLVGYDTCGHWTNGFREGRESRHRCRAIAES